MEKRNLLPCRRPSSASRWYQEPHRSAPNSKDMVEEKNVLQKIPQMLISLVTSTASILLMTYSQNRQQLSKPRAAGLWYFDQNIESSGKEKQNWTNFKIVLNFPVYESETDPGTLKPKSRKEKREISIFGFQNFVCLLGTEHQIFIWLMSTNSTETLLYF
ncbi:hypothetical protein AV530_010732 [Patagioenas fasciata monilis]|uniref:Uncharacterized protein n=1 Tax=Patagioenas fasciata monilis TaxID=372326 RepID=A0A1V4K7S5_PATFA|nr:hypothetical protein AV530_010732 [Patagioenas fasciata monilis]